MVRSGALWYAALEVISILHITSVEPDDLHIAGMTCNYFDTVHEGPLSITDPYHQGLAADLTLTDLYDFFRELVVPGCAL